MKKRGQITTFIIVAIVLVVAVLLFVFVNRLVSQPSGEPGIPDSTSVKRLTETCMKDIIRDGAQQLMVGGGYIDAEKFFPDLLIRQDSYLKMPMKLPYWFYRGQDRMPTKRDMEAQLEQYLNKNLPGCLAGFSAFDAFLDVKQHGPLQSQVIINREDISTTLDLTLDVHDKLKSKDEVVSGFVTTTPTMLGKLYALASILMKTENKQAYLEFVTDDIIASSNAFPYEGMQFTCKPLRWTTYQLNQELRSRLAPNLLLMRFDNTYAPLTGIPYYDKLYRFHVTDQDFSDVSVNVVYNPDWKLSMQVYPSRGSIVYPIEMQSTADTPVSFLLSALGGVCIKLFHHKYTVQYPVLYRVADITTGESFYFATPVLMKNNQANRHADVKDLKFQTDIEGSRRFCSNVTLETDYALNRIDDRMIDNGEIEVPKDRQSINV
ncbi:MAG: hypothetical protein GXP63_06875, partial [DPANN group archaeon]|nr:hypothetical protein [DPANN group archaeon]